MKWSALGFIFLLSGCNLVERLSTVGDSPELSHIQNPNMLPGYQPVTMPMPQSHPHERGTNSLWQIGSRAFFKDQRASKVGDILTIDFDNNGQQAKIEATPSIKRDKAATKTNMPSYLGLEKTLADKWRNAKLPGLVDIDSSYEMSGKSSYEVKPAVKFKIAAVITEVLPNGNFVIMGRQEVRTYNEVTEIHIKGILRPQDIPSSNIVSADKVAELRVSYKGRGDISDTMQFPWGHQVIHKLSPF